MHSPVGPVYDLMLTALVQPLSLSEAEQVLASLLNSFRFSDARFSDARTIPAKCGVEWLDEDHQELRRRVWET